MVHDAMGVSGHTMEEVLDPDAKGVRPLLWSASETFGAQDEVKALGEGALEVLCDGVEQGSVPGIICSRRPSGGLHEALWGRVLCVDVSPHAVTLLRLGRETTDTLQILLPAGTTRAHEAGRHLRYLVQEALVGGIPSAPRPASSSACQDASRAPSSRSPSARSASFLPRRRLPRPMERRVRGGPAA